MRTIELLLSVLLLSYFVPFPVYAQDAMTIVVFGSTDQKGAEVAEFLSSDIGLVAVSPEAVPIGTANSGSETTFKYQEVDVFTGVFDNGFSTATLTATGGSFQFENETTQYLFSYPGTLIASASGFRISVAAAPTADVNGLRIEEECAFKDDASGQCSINEVILDGDTTRTGVTVEVTGTGQPVPIPINSALAQSDSASSQESSGSESSSSSSTSTPGPGGDNSNNADDNAATSGSVSGINIIGMIVFGILLGVSKTM
ncbi:hypothetical protein VKT23_006201 [Stygiomarasmius scandens]|uniref:Uncharacterized protein n=1 Tax=Marasmiellus scandens TaxID=2682957 RepID=A0ABR1JQ59_9AGAR